MALERYRAKRNFSHTPEPAGEEVPTLGSGQSLRFVVQKHAARQLHYDFRLELDGVLLSWAVPKGPSLDPSVKRLAMQTEDHPLEYGSFEGVIPKGEYGGGTVMLWDQGTWEPESDPREMYHSGQLKFRLHGAKLEGSWHLVKTRGPAGRGGTQGGKSAWLFFKGNDEHARRGIDNDIVDTAPLSVVSGRDLEQIAAEPDRVWHSNTELLPDRAAPDPSRIPGAKRAPLKAPFQLELATLAELAPEGDEWLHELKHDGYRLLAALDAGRARLWSRNGRDWTAHVRSLARTLEALPVRSLALDGELVALRPDGRSDFQALQGMLGDGQADAATYFAFDLLYLDGYDLRGAPLEHRKRALGALIDALHAGGGRIRYSDHIVGDGRAFMERACALRLEGIVSKRRGRPYCAGRSRDWLKIKCHLRQEFVVGGYTDPAGARGHLGALLVGAYVDGELVYAGKVGTGFSDRMLSELERRLRPLGRKSAPFSNPPRGAEARGVHWIEPELVAEVEYAELTQDGRLRHPTFRGLRSDKAPRDVRLERPTALGPPHEEEPQGSRSRAGANARSELRAHAPASRAHAPASRAGAPDHRGPPPAGRAHTPATPTQPKAARTATAKKARATAPSEASPGEESASPREAAPSPHGRAAAREATAGKTAAAERRTAAARRTVITRAAPAGAPPGDQAAATTGDASPDPDERGKFLLTNPDRILYPAQGITKAEQAEYYVVVSRFILPHIARRLLTLVRCPEGHEKQCFFQKHIKPGIPAGIRAVEVAEKGGPVRYMYIDDLEGLLGLVQLGTLEIHTWGAHIEDPERPDQLVFDLDPDEGLGFERLREGAISVRERLQELGFESFVKTTGGKGLHVVVPILPRTTWDEAKEFTKQVAEGFVRQEPQRYVSTIMKKHRQGKIFIDYLRNGRGATAIAAFSTRRRPGAPVSVPLAWDELEGAHAMPRFTIRDLPARLAELRHDPWAGYFELEQAITTDAGSRVRAR